MDQTVDLFIGQMPYQVTRNSQTLSVTFLDENYMDELGYKVLSGVAGTNLLCGTKSRFNGRMKLTYNISDYVPLDSLYDSLTREQVFEVIGGLLDALEQIYDIGFLLYENISFQPRDILLKADSCRVYLLYMPVRKEQPIWGRPDCDRMFCGCMRSILSRIPVAKSMTRLSEALASPCTLAQLRELLLQEISDPLPEPLPEPAPKPPEPEPEPGPRWGSIFGRFKKVQKPEIWRLAGVDTPEPLELTLSGASFVVGRSAQKAQGVVGFNPTIGRAHCRFLLREGKWYLEDLKSTNGTYLNGDRLEPGREYAVGAGDRIKLSSTEFRLLKG